MNNQHKSDKQDLVGISLLIAEHDSRDKETAQKYLQSEGIDPAIFAATGLKKIKQLQLEINARRTDEAMAAAETMKQKAVAWVDKLLGGVDFSLTRLVEEEQLSVSFRNIETLDDEDVRAILIKHFTLKFINKQDKGTT